MPYKSEKIKLPREFNRTVKYDQNDKNKIHLLHKSGFSQRAIAREIGCSRRYVQFVLYPEKLEHNKELYAKRRADGRYYNKEKHRQAMTKTRRYKQELYLKGVLF